MLLPDHQYHHHHLYVFNARGGGGEGSIPTAGPADGEFERG